MTKIAGQEMINTPVVMGLNPLQLQEIGRGHLINPGPVCSEYSVLSWGSAGWVQLQCEVILNKIQNPCQLH